MIPTSTDIAFSNLDRSERLKHIQFQKLDLIIIGGGITGAGIALDASIRGLKTLLLEKRDFASGTSSKSTKLIHGGLRYLKQFEFRLVNQTGTERAVAHQNAPHLVHPESMLLPIVKDGQFNKYTAAMAISVYDLLAGVAKKDRKVSLSKSEAREAEPLLDAQILQSGVRYTEYRTDDARLTLETIKASRREGAEAFNYLEVQDFIYENNQVVGVSCWDKVSDQSISLYAKFVVSAAGPWVDKLRRKDHSAKGKSLHLTKGVHIVLSRDRLPIQHAVYFDAFDGRMIFAIPRGKTTYIGTSDTNYSGDLNRVLCAREDVEYLISKTNNMFKGLDLDVKDVISSWAGLRPLIHEDGKSPSELSRRDEIFISDHNLISIAGGKLTGFRLMSKKIVDLLLRKDRSLPQVKCATKNRPLLEHSFRDYAEFIDFQKKLIQIYEAQCLSEYDAWYLTSTFGKEAHTIIASAVKNDIVDWQEALIKAEIKFCIKYEAIYKPADYFNRRTGRLYFDISSVRKHLELIVYEFAAAFCWTAEHTAVEMAVAQELIHDVTIFKDVAEG